MALYEVREDRAEVVGGPNFDARLAMEGVIDPIITEIYLPFRGGSGFKTERKILVEPEHVPHRENDAEHSWHVEVTARCLWDYRHELGLYFPMGFDIAKAKDYAPVHDLPEIHAGDVDAMTRDECLLLEKDRREQAAAEYLATNFPFLRDAMLSWREYARKDTPEAQYISDIDKIIATRMIFLDGGKKWHGIDGYKTSREEMSQRMRDSLKTDMGHQLMDVLEADLDANPHVFPYHESRNDCHLQLSFDVDSAIMGL